MSPTAGLDAMALSIHPGRRAFKPQVRAMTHQATRAPTRQPRFSGLQAGVSLLELMVGIAIGLMVVAAAMGTLALSKNTSSTVSDASVLTSQANNVLRAMSFYVRQAGVLEFRPTGAPNTYLLDDPPAGPIEPLNPTEVLRGTDGDRQNTSDSLMVWVAHRADGITRDCQGNTVPAAGALMRNRFYIGGPNNNELMCVGALNDTEQAMAGNVEDFQVQYLQENSAGTAVKWVDSPAVTDWKAVTAVDICLQIKGELKYPTEVLKGKYANCKNANVDHDGYMRAVVRQTIQLRNRSTNL